MIDRTSPIYDDPLKEDFQTRLARIEGQVKGIGRMIESQRAFAEVLQQMASVRAALKGLTKAILRSYLQHATQHAKWSNDAAGHDELLETLCRFIKE